MINIFLFLFALLGCRQEVVECSESIPCGFGETCQEGTCVSQSCATSSQCPMESYCDKGSCITGCQVDEDCYPGNSCDVASSLCQTARCTDSQIDCDFKEICNGRYECLTTVLFFLCECWGLMSEDYHEVHAESASIHPIACIVSFWPIFSV